jgi:archaemetzincin
MRRAVVLFLGLAGCQCGPTVPSTVHETMRTPSPTALASSAPEAQSLRSVIARLAPLHVRKRKPLPGDWLAEHDEPGQTFSQWLTDDPVLPEGERNRLYIQPLGDLAPGERKLVDLTAAYMRLVFALPVELQKELPLSVVPAKARRKHPSWGTPQILTTYVLDGVLKPRLPDDAAACIALTASDLWPGEGWNFVFGQASLRDRVGVWSLHRYGDPEADFQRALVRTLKVAVHETGHMFSLEHCTAYECVMNGSNNLEETDRSPLWLCPECLAKILSATHATPVAHYEKLLAFAKDHGLTDEAAHFTASLAALR